MPGLIRYGGIIAGQEEIDAVTEVLRGQQWSAGAVTAPSVATTGLVSAGTLTSAGSAAVAGAMSVGGAFTINGSGVSFGILGFQKMQEGERLGGSGGSDPDKWVETIDDAGEAPAATKTGGGASGLFGD